MEDNKICTNPQCFCDGSCKGVVKSDANYSSEATMENKTAEEMITRGTGNFINCTDYEDAISVIKNLQQQLAEKDKEIESYMSLLDDASKTVVEKDKEIERYKEVLTELVELKKMKDSQGKTFIYCDRQPKAWQQAFDLIESLNK